MATTIRLSKEREDLLKAICMIDGDTGAAVFNKALDLYFQMRISDSKFRNKLDLKLEQLKDILKPYNEMLNVVQNKPVVLTNKELAQILNHQNHIRYTEGNHNDYASIWCEEHQRHERLENQDVV